MPPQLPIAIVGAGVVAQALGRSLALRGQPIVALAGRNPSRAERAAKFIGPAVQAVDLTEIPKLATRLLIAVSDDALDAVARVLADAGLKAGVALHTCGAKGPEALAPLRRAGVACGMIHPLQTVPNPVQGVERLRHITFGLAGDRAALDFAEEIVRLLESRPLHIAAERLSWYHAGAVLASNALVATIDAATVLMEQAGVEHVAALRAIDPLVRASVDNALSAGPRAALTGPVGRGDVETVAAHLRALTTAPPAVAALYRGTALHLVRLSRDRGLDERVAAKLEAMIVTWKGD